MLIVVGVLKTGSVKELRKLWNKKVIVIPIEFCALVTVLKSLEYRPEELEVREKIETSQATALLTLTKILKSLGEMRRLADTYSCEKPVTIKFHS